MFSKWEEFQSICPSFPWPSAVVEHPVDERIHDWVHHDQGVEEGQRGGRKFTDGALLVGPGVADCE